jgi:hypothetical protein
MAHAEGSITIDRPVNTVFDLIADGLSVAHDAQRPTAVANRVPLGKPPGQYARQIKL